MFLKSGLVVSTTPDKKDSFTGDNPLCGKRIGVIGGTVSGLLIDKMEGECADKRQPHLGQGQKRRPIGAQNPHVLECQTGDAAGVHRQIDRAQSHRTARHLHG